MKTLRCTGLLALALASLLLALPAQAARLALVIGNDNYQQISTLKNAGNDAKLIASALRRAGFDVSDHFNLDRNRLYEAIDGFQKRLGKGDEVVFYFSGHGVQVDNDPMLLPIDILGNDEKKLRRDALPLLYVQDALKDARVSLLVIDACRDNPFPKQGSRTIGDTRGLRPPDVVKGQAIIMSAGRNQKALDSVPGEPSHRNGLFTHEFVRVMRTPGLDVRSALVKVRDDVEDKAARVNHEQRPSLMDDMRGNFYLQAAIKPEPTFDRPKPGSDGLNLDDRKKEDDNNTKPARSEPMQAAQTNEVIDGRYQILDNGAVAEDLQTLLIWQRCQVGQTWNGTDCAGNAQNFTFKEANTLGGNGWRVPSVEELETLLTKAPWNDRFIHPKVFPNTTSYVWSSSTGDCRFKWTCGWPRFVDYNKGMSGSGIHGEQDNNRGVRLVRTGQVTSR